MSRRTGAAAQDLVPTLHGAAAAWKGEDDAARRGDDHWGRQIRLLGAVRQIITAPPDEDSATNMPMREAGCPVPRGAGRLPIW